MWYNRPKVTWTGGKKPKVPPPYTPDVELHPDVADVWKDNLIVGNLWFTTIALTPEVEYSSYNRERFITHELKYLWVASWEGVPGYIPTRTPVIYAGPVRVEESMATVGVSRILRHTFIVNGVRYMTRNLADFVPAEFLK